MTAFRATYSDLKLIKTRKCVQIIFEVPQEDFDAAYEVLGGLPNPATERWFGIAALAADAAQPRQVESKSTAGAKRPWAEMLPQQQAGIRIGEPEFSNFLRQRFPDEWHETHEADACLKMAFNIWSKKELETNQKARVLWTQLDNEYLAWKLP